MNKYLLYLLFLLLTHIWFLVGEPKGEVQNYPKLTSEEFDYALLSLKDSNVLLNFMAYFDLCYIKPPIPKPYISNYLP